MLGGDPDDGPRSSTRSVAVVGEAAASRFVLIQCASDGLRTLSGV
jgi:hypothetical protein